MRVMPHLVRLAAAVSLAAAALGLTAAKAPKEPQVPTRAGQQYLEVRQPDGSYKPIFVKGMNLSVALPGKHPSEFPHDEALYLDWLDKIADMNCNVVRLYTIHPPEMYKALYRHNTQHPDKPLWLIQGVWIEPPPAYNYIDTTFMAEVQMNISRAVDLVHGNAEFEDRPGWTGGRYKADVSKWLLAWLIGREWEPDDMQGFQKAQPTYNDYQGTNISCHKGQAIECWLARICDYAVTYEDNKYSVQHPVAYSSWPPTDPLIHVSESNIEEEADLASTEARGRVDIFSSDAVNISSKHFTVEPRFKAGVYASYHVYPYWPDFLDNEPAYSQAKDRFGPSNYYGYLAELKAYYNDRPLLIAEYGLASCPLTAHLQKQGWNHGGMSEEQVAENMQHMTYDIYDSGCAGGVVFSWIDEWFKKVWLWAEMYDPWDDRRLWYNQYDPEKNYGMFALLPGKDGPDCTLSGNDAEWADADTRPGGCVKANDSAPEIASVKVMHDEGFLFLRVQLNGFDDWEFVKTGLYLGLDVLDPARGNTCWPGPLSLTSDTGLEEVISFAAGKARLWQTETFRFWDPYRVPWSEQPQIAEVQPHILEAEANRWAWFEPVVETNRRRVGRDGAVYPSRSWELNPLPRGSLKPGPAYNDLAVWNVSPQSGEVEIRIPWILMGFVGPHQMRVLQAKADGTNGSEVSTGVGLAVALTTDTGSALAMWPGADGEKVTTSASGRYAWPEWKVEDIKYHSRLKPVYSALKDLFGRIDKEPRQPQPAPGPPAA